MVQSTISGHTGLGKRLEKQIKEYAGRELKDKARSFATSLIANTPIQPTAKFSIGAYANSFSFKINNTSSRGRRLKGSTSVSDAKSRIQEGQVYNPQEGFNKLLSDVENADYSDVKTMTFRNDSQHASQVENGTGWRRDGYHVFRNAKASFK